MNYETENLKERIKEITGGGADVVIDPVGGPWAEQALRSMTWAGRFVTVGFASGEIPRIPLNLVLLKGPVITGFTMQGLTTNRAEDVARHEAELWELLATGKVEPHVGGTFPLEEGAQALIELAERRATGKLLGRCPSRPSAAATRRLSHPAAFPSGRGNLDLLHIGARRPGKSAMGVTS